MPDNTDIERTIFKLEIDDSGYVRGIESMSASTKKLVDEQNAANKALLDSETILKAHSIDLQRTKKDLDDYSGTNERYRLQLKKTYESTLADNQKLTDKVNQNKLAYDAATKAAQNFADVSQRAANLQANTTGGKIPSPSIVAPPNVSASITNQIASVLNVPEFTAQAEIIERTKKEFDDLRVSIGLAEARMQQLNATDEEFKALAPIVAEGKQALSQYDDAARSATGTTIALRTQILNNNNELARLQQTGKGATDQYIQLEKETAHLTELYREQRNRINVLSQEFQGLNFGKAAIEGAISAFEVYTSISILAGGASEELQKKTMQLFAAMQLLTSLEQLANSVKRGSIISTNLQSAAQAVYTAVVGASTGALKAFRLALAATGIGAAIVLIGYLVSKWIEYRDAVEQAGENQKLLNEIVAESARESGKQIADLKILAEAARDSNLSMQERLKAVQALQKEFPDYFGNLSKEKILTGDITKETDALTESIKAAGRARAAKGKIDAIEAQRLELDFQKEKVINATTREQARVTKPQIFQAAPSSTVGQGIGGAGPAPSISVEQQKKNIQLRRENALADIKDKDEALARQEDFLTKFVGLDQLAKVTEPKPDKEKAKTDKAVKEIQNEFARKKAELDAQLAELTRKEADNESKIRIEFAARLAKEQLEIDKLLKEKKVTKPQAEILKTENIQINTLGLDKALADFRKKVDDARQKVNDDLKTLQEKNTQDQLNLIQDEFDRRAKLIEFNEQKELDAAKENTQKRLNALDLERLLIGEQAFQNAKNEIITAGEQQAINIIQRFANERKNLSADLFQNLLNAYTGAIANTDLIFTQEEARAIQSLSSKFLAGKISREKYEKDITKIQKDAEKDRLQARLTAERDELQALDHELASIEDKYSEHYAKLKKQRDDLAKKIAEDTITDSKIDTPDANKKSVDTVVAYAQAVGQLADSVIAFWQKANDAEAAALARSISIQENRVAAAQRIAERGNAEYLKAEEDKLTELNIKRENAARKQLGIDAALQASQILVGITGAISKIATPGIGVAETIAEVAVIIGALATGYGLVKSLQGNQPRLAEGTTYLQRKSHPAGIDTIPAWLTEGEAVIPQKKNRKYKKTVEAIYHEKVPAEVMEEFVENYVTKNNISKSSKTTKNKYEHFVENISKVPAKVLNSFIDNYEERKYFKGTPHVTGAKGVDAIPAWLTEGEAVIPVQKNKSYKKSVEAVYNGIVPASIMNDFVENYSKSETVDVKKAISESLKKDVLLSTKNNYSQDYSSAINKTINENASVSSIVKQAVKEVTGTDKHFHLVDKVLNENSNVTGLSNIQNLVTRVFKEINDQHFTREQVYRTTSKVMSENTSSIIKKAISEITGTDVYSKIVDSTLSQKQVKTDENFIQNTVSEILNKRNLFTSDVVSRMSNSRSDKNELFNLVNTEINKSGKIDSIFRKVESTEKYSSLIDKVFSENKSLVQRKRVSDIISKISSKNYSEAVKKMVVDKLENRPAGVIGEIARIPTKAIDRFIKNYREENFAKNFLTENQAKYFKDEVKTVSVVIKEVKPLVPAVQDIHNFIRTFHRIDQVPRVNYEHIKEMAEHKINHDGRLSALLTDQNKLIMQQNELQEKTITTLKKLGMNVTLDKNGFAVSQMEVIEQMRRDKRL